MRRNDLARLGDQDLEQCWSSAAFPRGFMAILRLRTADQGERRLALAVLLEAARCLDKDPKSRDFTTRLARWEAEQWFACRRCEALFCFENVCAILGLNAEAMRQRLLPRRKPSRLRKEAPPPALLECTLGGASLRGVAPGSGRVGRPASTAGSGRVVPLRRRH